MPFAGVEISRVRDYWDARPCNIRHSVGLRKGSLDPLRRRKTARRHWQDQ